MSRALALLCLLSAIVLAGSATTTTAQQPYETVRLFIQLPDNPRQEDANAVSTVGGRARHFFPESNTFSIEIPAIFAPYLQQFGRFIDIRPVPRVQLLEDQLDWGVDHIQAEQVWGGTEDAVNVGSGRPDGTGVKVAVIDTGAGPHPDLNVLQWTNCITPAYNSSTPCTSGGADDHGHGTHVAGTVAGLDNGFGVIGVAPKASLYSVKVLDAGGSGWMDDVAAAINWAAANDIDIAQMSVGCYWDPISACNDPVVANAVGNAYNGGMVLIAAAGNNGQASNGTCLSSGSQVNYPALYAEVMAVAAVNSANVKACWSSIGPDVEISAPGVTIRSTVPLSCPGLVGTNCSSGYAAISGTSMATPHVSGVAALILDCNPGLNPAQVYSRLTSTAIDLGSSGRDPQYGYGLVQADDAVVAAGCSLGSAPTPDFSVSCNPASLAVTQGDSTTTTCSVTSTGGFSGPVSLGCGSLVSGLSCSFNPASVTPAANGSANSTLTLDATAAATTGSDGFQVSGTNNGTTRSTNLTVNVAADTSGQPVIGNTGYRGCSSTAAVTSGSGDNNGFQSSASGACADGGTYARDDNSGNGTSTSCTSTNKDRHVFSGFGLSVPSDATVNGIEVRLDAWADSSSSSPHMCVEVSRDGGATWSATKQTANFSRSQRTYNLGSTTDTWGLAWTPAQVANLRLRITDVASSTSRDFRLDYAAVRVTYSTGGGVITPPEEDEPAATPDFSIDCSPTSLTVEQGEAGNSTCTLTSTGGFNSPVTLACAGLGSDASCSFNGNPVTPPADGTVNRTLTVSVDAEASPASDAFQVTATSGALSRSANLSVDITAAEEEPSAPVSTGFRGCATNAAVTDDSGDNNGYQTNASYACANDSSYARDDNSGNGTSTSCASVNKDRHVFRSFGSIPANASVNGIEVRLDAWASSTYSSPKLCVEVSKDGGATWSAARTTANLATSQRTYTFGDASDLWGLGSSMTGAEATGLRVRVTSVASSTARDFRLDWVAVNVTYTP
jgi:subtilisin family serine protease